MRPRRVATLLLVAALAGAVAWWAAGRTPDVDPGPIASVDGAIDDAPPADAPELAVAPPSLSRRVAAVPDGTDEDRGAVAPLAPGGVLTVRIELPSPPDPALATLPLRLRFASRDGVEWVPPAGPTFDVEATPTFEWLHPIDPFARGPSPVCRIANLPAGEWLVDASLPEIGSDGLPPSWGPIVVHLGASPVEATLPLSKTSSHGRLRLSATLDGVATTVTFHVGWRGFPLAAEQGLGLEMAVPADEDLVVRAVAPDEPSRGPAPPRTVRVVAGAVEDVEFELPPLVTVRILVFVPGGFQAPRASFAIWRIGGSGQHVQQDRNAHRGDGTENSVLSTRLSPGDYRVLVTDVGPYLPVWQDFVVSEVADALVEIRLERTGPEATCLVQRADGTPASGYGLWIGRLDGSPPERAETGLIATDAVGVANFGARSDGEYLVADFGNSVWRTVRIAAGHVEPAVLRLPSARLFDLGPRITGRVRSPSGQQIAKGLVSVGPPDDWQRYAHYHNGRFELSAPVGDGVLTVHHSWYELDRFAPWSSPVVVESGKDQTFDVLLRPR